MEAFVVHVDHNDGAETIKVNGHEIQFGYGSGGDGFCYAHQSFDCIEHLSKEEWLAIKNAREQQEINNELIGAFKTGCRYYQDLAWRWGGV